MARVVDHLSVGELGARYEACEDVTSSRHFQTIYLLAKGHSTREVAEITSFGQRWIEQLVERYNAFGPALWAIGVATTAASRRFSSRICWTAWRASGRSAARRRGLDERQGRALDGRRTGPGEGSRLSAAGRRCRRSAGRSRSRGRATRRRRRRKNRRRSKKTRRRGRRGSGAPSRHAGRGLRDRRAPDRAEAGDATGLGAGRRAADRAWPSPLRMALCDGLRIPGHRRMLLVRLQRRIEAVLRGAAARLRRGKPAPAKTASSFSCSTTPAGTPRQASTSPRGFASPSCRAYTPELQPAECLWDLVDEPIVNKYIADVETLEAIISARCAELANDRQDPEGPNRLPLVAAYRQSRS